MPQRERFQAARPLRVAVARLDLEAGQAQAVVGVGAVGGERPRRQARQALLGGDRPRTRPSRARAPGAPTCWCRG